MEGYGIRLARAEDARALLSIYAPYVTGTSVTFEYEAPSLEEFAGRVTSILADYPYLVCEHGGEIVGYAYAHRYKERAAYQWDAELSIYLSQAQQGRGVGRALYGALIELLRMQNVKNVYGGLLHPNVKSERMHEALGFTRVGFFPQTGYKNGAWRDVVWYGMQISACQGAPEPLRSIRSLDAAAVSEVLARYAARLNRAPGARTRVELARCDGTDARFIALTRALDEELKERYGAQMTFYGAFNKIADVETAVVASIGGEPAACGCFKPFSEGCVEMKRIYAAPRFRGRGAARAVLAELERWAQEAGYARVVLETGTGQPEAIGLYESGGYTRIPNYPPYEDVFNSVCYEKRLTNE